MKKHIKWIIGGIIVILLTGFYAYSEMHSGMPVQTMEVTEGQIRSWVEDRAMTHPSPGIQNYHASGWPYPSHHH